MPLNLNLRNVAPDDISTLAGAIVAAGADPEAAAEIAVAVADAQAGADAYVRLEAETAATRAAIEATAAARTKADAYAAGVAATEARYKSALDAFRSQSTDAPAHAAAAVASEKMRWGAVFAALGAEDRRIEAAQILLSQSTMQPDAILAVVANIPAPRSRATAFFDEMAKHRDGAEADATAVDQNPTARKPDEPSDEEREAYARLFRGMRSAAHTGSVGAIGTQRAAI